MSTIQQLFNEFLESGGQPKVTEFKRYFDKLVNEEIKPQCGRSSKSVSGDDWRSELNDRFGGRGAKWVKVSIEEVTPTLASLGESEDVVSYVSWIEAAGYAWIRFKGPRVVDGQHMAAFEVRTKGSTINHPEQLHYVPVVELDERIELMGTTPYAAKLEVTVTGGDDVDSSDELGIFDEGSEVTTIGEFVVTDPVVVEDDVVDFESYDEGDYDDDDEDFDSAF